MAMEQYFQERVAQHEVDGDELPLQKWNSISDAATAADSATGCFDCNICLDNAQDPVVTLCGHLYCWPCIYKWLHFQSISPDPEQQQRCPVCKADVSHTTLVPLYGRGQDLTQTESNGKTSQLGIEIPQRPPACGVHAMITTSTTSRAGQLFHRNPYYSQSQAYQQQQYHHPHQYSNHETAASPSFNLSGTTTTNMFHPIVGMLGEMVYARAFGNSETSIYTYPNSYHLTGNSSPRMRRQEMQTDKSLNRVSIFLLCCLVLCLLLF